MTVQKGTVMINRRLVKLALAALHTIRDEGSAPSGVLYAGLMSAGCSLNDYQIIEGILMSEFSIRKDGDVLVWTKDSQKKYLAATSSIRRRNEDNQN